MAVSRAMLEGMGLTKEQASAIIEAHTETIDGLKKQRDEYKADADRLKDVQKELDDLKAGTTSKAEYEKLRKEFDDYKADVSAKETAGKIKAAYRKLLDDQKIAKEDADLIMSATNFDGMKLTDNGVFEDAEKLTNDIKTNYARYIPTVDTKGAKVDNPPSNNGGGANPRAAEIAKQFHERRYGKATDNNDKSN